MENGSQEMTALSGMNAIRDYCRSINLSSSEATVIKMINQYGFPARKIGGIWESDRISINRWRRSYIEGEVMMDEGGNTVKNGGKNGRGKMVRKGKQ